MWGEWASPCICRQALVQCKGVLALAGVGVRGCPPVSWGRPDCRGNAVNLVDLQAPNGGLLHTCVVDVKRCEV